ncbi:MAG: hypothetical protein QM666_02330 [Acinetobacter sp.]
MKLCQLWLITSLSMATTAVFAENSQFSHTNNTANTTQTAAATTQTIPLNQNSGQSQSYTQNASTIQTQPKSQLPDNPNLGQVLLYKTGKTIERVGNATQRGATKASDKLSQKWDNTKQYRNNAEQTIQQKTTEIKDVGSQKWQQTKEVVTGQRPSGTNVPIEQGTMSQSN